MQELLKMVLGSKNSDVVEEIGKQFDLEPQQARQVLERLLPSLQRGMHQNALQQEGFESLLRALLYDDNGEFIEHPERITGSKAVDNGNDILGYLLGSKKVSRRVAETVGNKTGIDQGVLKQMLPLAANLLMATLSTEIEAYEEKRRFLYQILELDNDNLVLDDASGAIGKSY